MKSVTRLSAVTGLYDLGRVGVDGRSIATYIEWLNKTLRLPVPFTIFLDPAIDAARIIAKPGDHIVQVPLETFGPFAWRDRLSAVLAGRKRIIAKRDMTFLLPDYALFMYSKFEMVRRAAEGRGEDEGIVWLDAGISRFFAGDMAEMRVDADYLLNELQDVRFAAAVTPTLARDLAEGQLSKQYVGTCQRLVTGCDFYFNAASAAGIERQMMDFVENDWLANGLWDNEQIALGYLYAAGIDGSKIVATSLGYGEVIGAILGAPPKAILVKRTLLEKLRRVFQGKSKTSTAA